MGKGFSAQQGSPVIGPPFSFCNSLWMHHRFNILCDLLRLLPLRRDLFHLILFHDWEESARCQGASASKISQPVLSSQELWQEELLGQAYLESVPGLEPVCAVGHVLASQTLLSLFL